VKRQVQAIKGKSQNTGESNAENQRNATRAGESLPPGEQAVPRLQSRHRCHTGVRMQGIGELFWEKEIGGGNSRCRYSDSRGGRATGGTAVDGSFDIGALLLAGYRGGRSWRKREKTTHAGGGGGGGGCDRRQGVFKKKTIRNPHANGGAGYARLKIPREAQKHF